jgi:hypothetical protein
MYISENLYVAFLARRLAHGLTRISNPKGSDYKGMSNLDIAATQFARIYF